MAKLNLKGVSPSKRRLVYKIFAIYRDCGYLPIYKQIFADDMGRILKYSEFNLDLHLKRLEQGEPEWMFKFKSPDKRTSKPIINGDKKEVVKKVARQLSLFALLFLFGCGMNPVVKQMQWENRIMGDYPAWQADQILAEYYTSPGSDHPVFPAPTPSVSVPETYFYQSSYYKNFPSLKYNFGTRRCR